MKRRNFIRKLSVAAGAPIALNGVPIKLLAARDSFQQLAAASNNDKVLIILQLHGGNDGINTFIPLDQYDQYFNRRANIAIPYKGGNRTLIPLDSTLSLEHQVGLHPDMQDFKFMYDQGKASVVQGVSYDNNNGSHFRGRDIWFMGGNSDDYFSSGWVGRYLSKIYEPLSFPQDFPTDDMPDPLALEMGNDVSLLFHQTGNIPTALALPSSPTGLANLIERLEGFEDEGVDPRGLPPAFLNGSPYDKEMDWILGLEDKSEVYIKRLQEVYENAPASTVTYPEIYPFGGNTRNPLTNQLQLVARLLHGGGPDQGVKTKVFLVKIGGFDTHAQQVESYDSTFGAHSSLVYHISSAMRAFQRDLATRGIEDRVLTMTMSEFGRRVGSNGSYGTDHGTGASVMLFGRNVNPGVYGNNPDMTLNNVAMQYDYRQLYATILRDWMEVDEATIANDIFFGDFLTDPNLVLTREVVLGKDPFIEKRYGLDSIYPNPAKDTAKLRYHVNDRQSVDFQLIDAQGKSVRQLGLYQADPGNHTIDLDLKDLTPGIYFVKVSSEKLNATQKLVIR